MTEIQYILVGWLIDGSGAPPQNKMMLGVNNGEIVSLESVSATDQLPTPYTDLSHCTVLPPLVDAHMHLFMSGTTCVKTRRKQLVASYEELTPVIRQHIQYLYAHGVLAARDGGDFGGYAARFKAEEQMPQGFQLKVAGKAWRQQKRYGRLIGRSPKEDERLVDAFLKSGEFESTDQIKLVNSGLNSLKIFGKETRTQFSVEEIRSLVDEANSLGKKIMVHANGAEPVRIALEAGCHSIEHGFFMGEENIKLMAEKNVVWIPTLFTMKAYGMFAGDKHFPGDPLVVKKNLEHQLEQLRLARELGVTVALGTDAGSLGVLHGEAMVEEIKLYKKAGYTLAECIRCATNNGAELLGVEDFGLLRPGKKATFLVTRGAPAQLPRKLSYLESIYIEGRPSEMYRKNPVKHV